MTENRPSQPQQLQPDQEGSQLSIRLDRREFFKRAIALGVTLPPLATIILDACSKGSSNETPTSFPSPTVFAAKPAERSTLIPSVSNAEIIATPDIKPTEITSNLLTTPFRKVYPITDTYEFNYMTQKPGGTDTVLLKDLLSDMNTNWNLGEDFNFDSIKDQPATSLQALLSMTVLGGLDNDMVDFSKTSEDLKDLHMPRVTLSEFPDGKTEEAFSNTNPPGWTVRKDAHMVVIGTYKDKAGEARALVSVDDSLRKKDHVTLSVASVPLILDQSQDGETSLADLLEQSGATFDQAKGTVSLSNGKEQLLNTIDSDLVDLVLNNVGGIYFMDKDPLKKNPDGTPVLFENPVVPYPPQQNIQKSIRYDSVALLPDGRLVAEKDGDPVARAVNFGTWAWIEGDYVNKLTRRELAEKAGVELGTLIDSNANFGHNETWDEIARDQFTLGVNSLYWHQMMPNQGQPIDFSLPDSQVKFAIDNNLRIRGDALVYSFFVPPYVKDGTVTGDALKTMRDNFITQAMQRYSKNISEWIVVNEASVVSPLSDQDLFYKAMGPDYVLESYRTARKVGGEDAVLLYNDFDCYTVSDPRYANVKKIVDDLKAEKLIDGLGLEMHIDASKPLPAKEDLIAGMQSYGLPISITEMDVDIRNVQGTEEQRLAFQAQVYKTILDAVRESKVCKSISFWSFGDRYSWEEQAEFGGSSKAEPTLYDDQLKEKPAAQVVASELQAWVV